MPAIVDHDEVRMQILKALQRCIENRPFNQIPLRDIAAEAGMSHAKLGSVSTRALTMRAILRT